MAQQAPFKKLKEQIEAAKRGLTEMSDVEIADSSKSSPLAGPAHEILFSRTPSTVGAEPIKAIPRDELHSGPLKTEVVDMVSKTVPSDAQNADHAPGSGPDEMAREFQFFHRAKQPKHSGGVPPEVSLNEADNVDVDALLFERLGRRLSTLEGNIEENSKYILELINLLSQLDLRHETPKKKSQPLQRFNRRYMFWLVIAFLAVGWFGLTPSGHTAVQHFLALI